MQVYYLDEGSVRDNGNRTLTRNQAAQLYILKDRKVGDTDLSSWMESLPAGIYFSKTVNWWKNRIENKSSLRVPRTTDDIEAKKVQQENPLKASS